MEPLRIVLAEDSGLLRESLSRMLTVCGFEVLAAVGDAEALVEAVEDHEPDVALTDVRMPPTFVDEGLRAAIALRAERPALGILVLSAHADSAYVMELLGGGARGVGYLLKDRVSDVDALSGALHRVARGETVVDPHVISTLLDRPRPDQELATLTERERELLGLVAEGRSNEAIASTLFLSTKTVESHMRSILMKLNIRPTPDDHRRVLAVLRYLRET